MELNEKTLKKEIVYQGRKFAFCSDEVLLPNGETSRRDYVAHPGGVTIAALDENDNLYFVRQFRYPYGRVILELPAGTLEKDEDPMDAGLRELKEETGAICSKLESLGEFYPSVGYCNEVIYLYYARVESVEMQSLDEDEFINVVKIPLKKAVEMVLNNEIKDGKTQVAVLKLAAVMGE
ncbi:MAG: NUDIX hydrolase [Clostridia bacterium]|nr:NUDIX hydrolase [Clostridia bacterium]